MSAYATRVDGYYSIGGVLLPSISTVLAPMKGDYPWDTKWADRGTITHLAMHAQATGDVEFGEYVDEWIEAEIKRQGFRLDVKFVYPMACAGIAWTERYVERIDRVERPCMRILSPTLGYAGQPDWDGATLAGDDGLWLIDIKTQSDYGPEKWHVAQIAAQDAATHLAMTSGPGEARTRCNRFANLYVTPEGAQLRPWTRQEVADAYARCFLQHLQRHNAQRVVAATTANAEEWRSVRQRAGYWPPKPVPPSTSTRRARVSAAQWGHVPTEAG